MPGRALPKKYNFDVKPPSGTIIGNADAVWRSLLNIVKQEISESHGPSYTYNMLERMSECMTIEEAPIFDFSTIPGYKRPRRLPHTYDVFELIEKGF